MNWAKINADDTMSIKLTAIHTEMATYPVTAAVAEADRFLLGFGEGGTAARPASARDDYHNPG